MAKSKRDDNDILSVLTDMTKNGKIGSIDFSVIEQMLGDLSDEELLNLDKEDLEGLEFDDDDVDDFDDLDDIDDFDESDDDE